jgi:hypothetical protein
MNVEMGNEAAQFHFWKYMLQTFDTLHRKVEDFANASSLRQLPKF